ncbi:hypothetical protein PT974_05586 [Cladobotryum mycophilum]|uniref:Uncharacterized protein n=1 Tax=Cladobotryum mycophilum TaxID=491253 RepID=A0ABR0SJ59_9HYPO
MSLWPESFEACPGLAWSGLFPKLQASSLKSRKYADAIYLYLLRGKANAVHTSLKDLRPWRLGMLSDDRHQVPVD